MGEVDTSANFLINKYIKEDNTSSTKEDVVDGLFAVKDNLKNGSLSDSASIISFDNSNELTKNDFVNQFYNLSNSEFDLLNEELDMLYAIIDTNNDGAISKEEMEIFVKSDFDDVIKDNLNNQINFEVNSSKGVKKIGSFSNDYFGEKKAEEVNANLFDGPVVTLSKYEQQTILSSGFIGKFSDYTPTKEGNCFWKQNPDGSKDFVRVVNDNGNYKIIHSTLDKEGKSNTEVFGIERKNISNFSMPESFNGALKEDILFDNLGNYHLESKKDTTLKDLIKDVYNVDINSEKGQLILQALINKNKILKLDGASSIVKTKTDIILVDDKELEAMQKVKTSSNLFDSNVELSRGYNNPTDTTMGNYIIGPSNPDSDTKYPLIVYLHGLSDDMQSPNIFTGIHSPGGFMSEENWKLENFNGYVLCPHLSGKYYGTGGWDSDVAEQNLRNLISEFCKNHNIDESKIAITGASWGGKGTTYMASHMSDVFCSAATISGYPTSVNPADITIPIRGYVGDDGDETRTYMEKYFGPQIGTENSFTVHANHARAPQAAFSQDLDGDNQSDLIKWLFNGENSTTLKPNGLISKDFIQSEPVIPKNVTKPKNDADGSSVKMTGNDSSITITGGIKNVNWTDYGYNSSTGQKFVQSAEDVTARLKAKGISTNNNCLGGVKNTFVDVTGENPFGNISIASKCASVMEKLEGYREIKGVSIAELQYLPAGSIVVWSSSDGDDPASKYGHISISMGDGRESSDNVHTQYRTVGANGKPRVWIPIN